MKPSVNQRGDRFAEMRAGPLLRQGFGPGQHAGTFFIGPSRHGADKRQLVQTFRVFQRKGLRDQAAKQKPGQADRRKFECGQDTGKVLNEIIQHERSRRLVRAAVPPLVQAQDIEAVTERGNDAVPGFNIGADAMQQDNAVPRAAAPHVERVGADLYICHFPPPRICPIAPMDARG